MALKIHRPSAAEVELAFEIVTEYYAAASVVTQENREEFQRQYFEDGAGVWLAEETGRIVGCVALRRLEGRVGCAEIKRMYVRTAYRGRGIADALLDELESYAQRFGYDWLYLDTAADMIAAARFYERKGFVKCEQYNDNPQAALFMRKRL